MISGYPLLPTPHGIEKYRHDSGTFAGLPCICDEDCGIDCKGECQCLACAASAVVDQHGRFPSLKICAALLQVLKLAVVRYSNRVEVLERRVKELTARDGDQTCSR